MCPLFPTRTATGGEEPAGAQVWPHTGHAPAHAIWEGSWSQNVPEGEAPP